MAGLSENSAVSAPILDFVVVVVVSMLSSDRQASIALLACAALLMCDRWLRGRPWRRGRLGCAALMENLFGSQVYGTFRHPSRSWRDPPGTLSPAATSLQTPTCLQPRVGDPPR